MQATNIIFTFSCKKHTTSWVNSSIRFSCQNCPFVCNFELNPLMGRLPVCVSVCMYARAIKYATRELDYNLRVNTTYQICFKLNFGRNRTLEKRPEMHTWFYSLNYEVTRNTCCIMKVYEKVEGWTPQLISLVSWIP